MSFRIGVRVWGGVTGERTSVMKSNGKVIEYETRAEAEKEATKLRLADAERQHRTANFDYWTEEVK